jgi:aspartate aminotransferase-like enzyme
VFRTAGPVVTATGSATLLMEAAVASCVRRRSLHLVNGAFSERWFQIALSRGKEPDRVEVPAGEAVDPDLVRAALGRARYDAVTVAHSETSTGVLNPIREIARAIHEESDALVLVDAVSSLAGAPVEPDDWGLDVVVAASQKALALPPGLSFAAISERAEDRMGSVDGRGFYTDLARYLGKHREEGTITTAAVTLYYALERQLEHVLGEGMEARWARHRALREETEEWARSRGIGWTSAAGNRSPTVSALRSPEGWTAADWVDALARRGFTVGSGYGPLKATSWRVGHMGEVGLADLRGLLDAADDLVRSR